MKQKIQLGLFGLLLTVLVIINIRYLWGPAQPPAPIAASASERRDSVIGSVAIPDAELHLDLLESARRGPRSRPGRNIFAYRIERAPVRQVAPPTVEKTPEPEPTPLPPPPPRAPYRFFGMVEDSADGGRQVFLTNGVEIFPAREGQLLENRYRIVQIRKDSLELEDTRSGYRWVLWLEAEGKR